MYVCKINGTQKDEHADQFGVQSDKGNVNNQDGGQLVYVLVHNNENYDCAIDPFIGDEDGDNYVSNGGNIHGSICDDNANIHAINARGSKRNAQDAIACSNSGVHIDGNCASIANNGPNFHGNSGQAHNSFEGLAYGGNGNAR